MARVSFSDGFEELKLQGFGSPVVHNSRGRVERA